MKFVILSGSPHKKGTTNYLLNEFIKGLNENNHEIYRFDAAFKDVAPCKGCYYCKSHDEKCVISDDMDDLYPKLLEADVIVFTTPLYYFTYSAQIKSVMDRFFAIDESFRAEPKKGILIATAGQDSWALSGLEESYHNMLKYLGWSSIGTVLSGLSVDMDSLLKTDSPKKAYDLAKSIK